MYARLLKPSQKSFFLFGPRGTGKSCWVKTSFPDAIYLDLLDSELFNDLLASPKRLENLIPKNFLAWIILDEIQRVPALLNEVHRLIEKYAYKFVLTSSSARKIRSKGVNLLAGRALNCAFYPLTVNELGIDFRLEHTLKFGQLPGAYVEEDPKRFLESYVKTYLREEIQQEGLTRSLGAFSRFLEAASFSQGSLLNMSAVARDCSVERKVVENYFSILEDLLLAYQVPVFSKKAKRRITAHPKFYFFDVGVYRTIRPAGPLDFPEEIEGIAFESLLFQELTAINDYYNLGYTLYYWRTSNNIEVDFVMYGNKGIKAFEVKRTGKVKESMLKGLKFFLRDYPMAKAYFVYGGHDVMRDEEIEIIPIELFLKDLPSILAS